MKSIRPYNSNFMEYKAKALSLSTVDPLIEVVIRNNADRKKGYTYVQSKLNAIFVALCYFRIHFSIIHCVFRIFNVYMCGLVHKIGNTFSIPVQL